MVTSAYATLRLEAIGDDACFQLVLARLTQVRCAVVHVMKAESRRARY